MPDDNQLLKDEIAWLRAHLVTAEAKAEELEAENIDLLQSLALAEMQLKSLDWLPYD